MNRRHKALQASALPTELQNHIYIIAHLLIIKSPSMRWCPKWDLNPYGFLHSILSRTRIPIPPFGHRHRPTIIPRNEQTHQFPGGPLSLLFLLHTIDFTSRFADGYLTDHLDICIISCFRISKTLFVVDS